MRINPCPATTNRRMIVLYSNKGKAMNDLTECGFEEINTAGVCNRCLTYMEAGELYYDPGCERYVCGWCADTIVETWIAEAEEEIQENECCGSHTSHRKAA